ncbi:LysM peptidoglycan-binding domain-containing protein [Tumebacillus sp. DT12]|uniref:LysM peptidoglycan-binding domain-containing protein n=1 Tax=Tumebacillus lacus TaxID=2995335 RepID=A0ABT3X044_9BACL|nr:LysM peptidoglycan-binding domain-containing protein [Tumebacillus lacus]MCX7570273.1 LysM peptidoglycan-binding domain-containing protein [Tumebacillus lacus]
MGLEKATIIVVGKNTKIPVLFNPTEYSLSSGNSYAWHKVPGLNQPIAQYIIGETPTLTMDLFFDTSEKKSDVRTYTKKVSGLLNVDKDLHAPPVVVFVWGSLSFKGIVEKVSQKFTMFLESGIPVRATLNITFREYKTMKEQWSEIPRQSADRTKHKMLSEGDQLWMIAEHEYEDPGLWRSIADANSIDNPRRLETGRRITIPRLE